MEWRLFLQAYVAAAGYREAFEAASALIGRIGATATVRECRVRPYAKFEDQYGVWLDLDAPAAEAAFDTLFAELARGWRIEGDGPERFAIWDHRRSGPAVLPTLRWLHLGLHPEPPAEDGA